MYRKRRMIYIAVFIFIPCIIVPLIYLSVFFNDFRSKVFREISFTAETEEGESYGLRARYEKDDNIYEVKIPVGISISDVVINTAGHGIFEIDDVIYENGDTLTEISYDTEYDIKMYTEDEKLLNEGSLIFLQDTENVYFSYDTEDENVSIVSTAEENRLPDPQGMEHMHRRVGERSRFSLKPGEIGLAAVFAVCCLYLLYRQLKISGVFKRGGKSK